VLSGQSNFTYEQQLFIDLILPVVEQVNTEIAKQRTAIYELYQQYQKSQSLDSSQKVLIHNHLKFYRCNVPDDILEDSSEFQISDEHFKELLRKVDIIPRKLVLAQAALESNWGKSRFVKEGNNYFGIRCKRPGCGIAPKKVNPGKFWVKSYPSILAGVRDYMRLLNSSMYYKEFRDLRIINRLNNNLPDAFFVVKGLERYSSKGKAYTNSLVSIMKINFNFL